MDYELIVDPDVFAALRGRIPTAIVPCIERSLIFLSDDPLSRGRKPLVPTARLGQVFYFECEADTIYHLGAHFVFTVDERAVYVRRLELVVGE
ncbi:MAG TPA: hypothetical protein VMF30_01650 [Pirellulales bacterium]|nr:hypothetical protein [Pirellulales bacterium]